MDEKVNQDKNGEADGMNLEVDSKDKVTDRQSDRQTEVGMCDLNSRASAT